MKDSKDIMENIDELTLEHPIDTSKAAFCGACKSVADKHKAEKSLVQGECHIAYDSTPNENGSNSTGCLVSANISAAGKMAAVDNIMESLQFSPMDKLVFCTIVLREAAKERPEGK